MRFAVAAQLLEGEFFKNNFVLEYRVVFAIVFISRFKILSDFKTQIIFFLREKKAISRVYWTVNNLRKNL